jgi:hypothetical protein
VRGCVFSEVCCLSNEVEIISVWGVRIPQPWYLWVVGKGLVQQRCAGWRWTGFGSLVGWHWMSACFVRNSMD